MSIATMFSAGRQTAQTEYLAMPLELDDHRGMRFHALALKGGCLALMVLGVWAALTPIRELAIANGQIMPASEIRPLQHLDGGLVAELLVRPGSRVKAGDPMIRLADSLAARDLAQLRVRAEALALQRQQLAALMSSTMLELRPSLGGRDELATDQLGVFRARLASRMQESRTLSARLEQRRSDLAATDNEIQGLKALVAIYVERLKDREPTVVRGLTTRRDFLADQAQLQQTRTQLAIAQGRLITQREQINEAESQAIHAESEARRLWSEENARIGAELAEVSEANAKASDRVERLVLRAPVDGVVNFIVPKSPGDVVKAGETLAEIVSDGGQLQAEVEIRPDDIGHIRLGDSVELRVSTFDYAVYGKLQGQVTALSPSTFRRPNGEFYYKGAVALKSAALSDAARLAPGMVVTAEIVTGAKSFMAYLLRPVLKAYAPVLAER